MVYKIVGDFDDNKFEKMLKQLSGCFKFIYINETLYVALKDVQKEDESNTLMDKIFKPARNFYIKKIDETNIMKEHESIVTWCRDNLVALDRQRYEIEQQDKLQRAWKAMDNMEIDLKKIKAEKIKDFNELEQKGG